MMDFSCKYYDDEADAKDISKIKIQQPTTILLLGTIPTAIYDILSVSYRGIISAIVRTPSKTRPSFRPREIIFTNMFVTRGGKEVIVIITIFCQNDTNNNNNGKMFHASQGK